MAQHNAATLAVRRTPSVCQNDCGALRNESFIMNNVVIFIPL